MNHDHHLSHLWPTSWPVSPKTCSRLECALSRCLFAFIAVLLVHCALLPFVLVEVRAAEGDLSRGEFGIVSPASWNAMGIIAWCRCCALLLRLYGCNSRYVWIDCLLSPWSDQVVCPYFNWPSRIPLFYLKVFYLRLLNFILLLTLYYVSVLCYAWVFFCIIQKNFILDCQILYCCWHLILYAFCVMHEFICIIQKYFILNCQILCCCWHYASPDLALRVQVFLPVTSSSVSPTASQQRVRVSLLPILAHN